MINKLIAYGDSFVMGGGLRNDNIVYENSWPQLLGKKLGIDAINRGVGGGSNKLSINNLLEDIESIKCKDVLVIFSWTGAQRTAIFDEDQRTWYNYLPGHVPPDKNVQKKFKFYFESMYTDTDAALTLYTQQIFLSSFLNSLKVPYFFINSFNDMNQFFHYRSVWPHIFDMIDKSKYMLGYDNSIYNRICKILGKTCQDKFHPNEEGHDILASMMVNYINENNLI